MRERKWGGFGAAVCVLLSAAVACSNDKEDKGTVLVADGKPELGWRETPEHVERAPISLTASDGTGLELVSLKARTVIEDPLAFTELHLVFSNPEPRRREGRFEILLPHEAAISRFAMRVGDHLQEGEVVERRRAQQVYEDFLHRKQDPALLEKDAGNEFSARVFPIEANAKKEIIVAYSEELAHPSEPYRMLLHGLPSLRELEIDVQIGSSSATGEESSERARGPLAKLELRERDFVPAGDLEVRLPKQKAVALRSGELVVARVVVDAKADAKEDAKSEPIDGLTVLFDTSASRALGFGAQIERLSGLLAALRERAGGDFDLRVIAFDQEAREVFRGPASGLGLREKSALLARDALGASDLGQALAFLAREPSKHARVLVIGDGVITAGQEDTIALREAVAKLAAHGVTRLDALGEGGIQDRASLAALVSAGLKRAGLVLDARTPVPRLAERLLAPTIDRVEVKIAGASFVYPEALEGVQPGDARLVFAELPADAPVQIELVGAGAESFETIEAPRPLLARAIARAKIEAMSAELRALRPDASEERAELARAIVELSVSERVVSDLTALLVLETAADYERFGIAQNALSRILQVGSEGIEVVDRSQAQFGDHLGGGALDDDSRDPPTRDDRPLGDQPLEILRDEEGSRADAPASTGALEPQAEPQAEARSGTRARAAEPKQAAAKRERSSTAPPPPAAPAASSAPGSVGSGSLGSLGSIATKGGGGSAKDSAASGVGALARAKPAPRSLAAPSDVSDLLEAEAAGEASSRRGAPLPATPAKPLEMAAPLEIAAALEARAQIMARSAHGLSASEAAPVLRSGLKARAQRCYAQSNPDPAAVERVVLELNITDKGTVSDAYVSSGALSNRSVQACVLGGARALRFPKPQAGNASVQASVELSMARVASSIARDPLPGAIAPRPRPRPAPAKIRTPEIADANEGVLAQTLTALKLDDASAALALAKQAHARDPGDVIALVALGEALEASRDHAQAARAYGSIVDLFPSRADLRRMASGRLERLSHPPALALATDSYRRAVEQRPDHPSGHRALAYALAKQGAHEQAFEVIERALHQQYATDRFEGVDRILREDLSLIAAAWVRARPDAEARVRAVFDVQGLEIDRKPSLRFVLSWETDANDVDFHIYDGRGGHAFYQKPKLASGGSLYADITTGYGPECFAITGKSRAYPYVLQAHYFARGPMGYGMGKLQAIDHDGKGQLTISDHPFVIMKDKAFLELARIASR